MERTLDSTLLYLVRSRMVDDYPMQIGQCLDVITEADLWWRPDERSNALGNILLHLIGSNRLYVGYGVGARSIERDRASEFTARGNPGRAAIVDAWNETVTMMREVLDGLSPSQLMETTDRTGKTTTIASILLHASHHTAAHMGQVVWITKMRHPGALDEVWIRTRDRLASARKS
ncbi:MAG TPA: DinB family protein [Vicinamibacterales bacterium]